MVSDRVFAVKEFCPRHIAEILPLDDPEEALKFCRNLSHLLSKQEPQESLPEVSVVTPVYNESAIIPKLYARLKATLQGISPSHEIVFVDDGSSDDSLSVLRREVEGDPKVVILELTRNFGHQAAISAGFDIARGSVVVLMDGDLQDPPEEIPKLLSKIREGYDVAFATRIQRKESAPKRAAYRIFYRILRLFAEIRIPLDAGDFSAMTRPVVDIMKQMPERSRFMRGVRAWVGFRQIGVPVERAARGHGESKYTWDRLVSLALNGLITFSVRPIRFISLLGASISVCSVLLAAWYFLQRITVGLNPPGFATIVVLLCLFAGIQLITVGLIGEYVGRIFDESKKRPLYIIKKISRS